jgi:hypothetical protein
MFAVKVTSFGWRLNGRSGITGVMEANLSDSHIRSQWRNHAKRGQWCRIDSMDGRQAELDQIRAEVSREA